MAKPKAKNDIPFDIMNDKHVKWALLATILFTLLFAPVKAQESNVICDESIASNVTIDTIFEAEITIENFILYLDGELNYFPDPNNGDSLQELIKEFIYKPIEKKYPNAYVNIIFEDSNNSLGICSDPVAIKNKLDEKLQEIYIQKYNAKKQEKEQGNHVDNHRLALIIALIGCITLLAFLIKIAFRVFRKENSAKHNSTMKVSNSSQPDAVPVYDDNDGIEIRSVTTSVLRKQSLEDVVDNDNYLVIDGKDFCDATAVRRMYIKDGCIKGIYNMYAEDMRKSDSPNENGCMIIGRWVYDSDSGQYDVSLEELVFPDNDAVFSQYEINFGGKIKMKIFDRLQNLRERTDLQHDVTCWVHSHPNLGVFFSNSDCNVQMQLKHPTHPNFLTAIVVDILTPTQELGIFTFQKDGTINSKAELKRLYSLKEWFNWAVKRELNYNILSDTQKHDVSCRAIFLSNNVILDMNELAYDSNDGTIRLILGTTQQNANGETECVADKLSEVLSMPNDELVGAFVADLYCSIPSVRKAVADYLDKIKFVLVYSSSNKILSSIPVVNNDLCEDISYYGEQNLEDLIKWTRKTN